MPSASVVELDFFDFSYLDGREEIERYWVNEPFSYVSILYNERKHRYSYHVTEPALDEFEQYVREDLVRTIRNSLMYRDVDDDRDDRRQLFENEIRTLIEEHAATVDPASVQKLQYYLVRDFVDFGRIDPLMRDPAIEDISCDGTDVPVFVYHQTYRDLRTNISFTRPRLNSLVVRLAQQAGKHLSVSNPLIDASLPNGSRIQLTLGGDVTSRGSNFTIRKFSDVPYTPIDLINWNTFSLEQMAYLWLCIENNRSLVFAGGTGSGKTTSLNAISFFIPPDSKVVSIEDTREISLPHDNWVQSLTRQHIGETKRGEIGTHELLQASLRQRPEYLLVGEIRTDQRVALTFFQAISTGHTCYTTVHADTVDGAISRLQNPPLSVPTQMLEELDILSIQKQVFVGDDRIRRNQAIAELSGDTDGIDPHVVFERDARADTHDKTGESTVLEEIAEMRGWTDDELTAQLERRERVLEYLVDNDLTDYRTVSAVIHTFYRKPDHVLSAIDGGELDVDALTELDDE
jgi:flagellar protein FlaI